MNIAQNTEFVLTKIDSLMNKAMPHLEKGAEEVIKYKVIEFRVQYLIIILVWITLAIAIKKLSRILIDDKWNGLEDGDLIALFIVGIVALSIGLIVTTAFSLLEATSFILSFTSPEIFAILQLIGR